MTTISDKGCNVLQPRILERYLCLLVLLLAGCSDPEITRLRYLEKADSYFANADFDKARVEYLNALRIEPNDAAARYGAGSAFEKLGSFQQAMGHYSAATEIDPQHLESRLALGKLLIMGRASEEARPYIESALAIAPDSLDARALQASLVGLEGALDEAERLAQAVVDEAPDHRYAVPLLASRLVSTGRVEQAKVMVERAVARAPDFVGFRGVYAQVFWDLGDTENYLEQLKLIAKLEPETLAHEVTYARALLNQGRRDEAINTLKARAMVAEGAEEARRLYLGFLSSAAPDVFETEAKALIAEHPEESDLRLILAEQLERTGRYADASVEYEKLQASSSERVAIAARLAGAREMLRTNQLTSARNVLEAVRADVPGEASMLRLASDIAVAEGDLDRAIGELRVVLRDNPADLEIRRRLISLYRRNNQSLQAVQFLEESLELPEAAEDSRLQLEAGKLAMGRGDFVRALEISGRLVGADTNNSQAHELRFRAALGASDSLQALDSARELTRLQPDTGAGEFYEGLALQARGDAREAIDAFERSLLVRPGASEPLAALLRLYLAQEQHDRALQLLAEQEKSAPANPLIRKYRGDVFADQKRWTAAIEIYRGLVSSHPNLPVTYQALARSLTATDDSAQAVQVLQRGVALTKHRPLYAELALAQQLNRDVDSAIETYRTALIEFPGDDAFANNLAMLIAEYRPSGDTLQEALDLVRDFASQDNAAYLDTLGWVYVKRGEYKAAVRILERAASMAPDSSLLRYHLGSALLGGGETERAEAELRLALSDGSRFAGADDAKGMLEKLSSRS